MYVKDFIVVKGILGRYLESADYSGFSNVSTHCKLRNCVQYFDCRKYADDLPLHSEPRRRSLSCATSAYQLTAEIGSESSTWRDIKNGGDFDYLQGWYFSFTAGAVCSDPTWAVWRPLGFTPSRLGDVYMLSYGWNYSPRESKQ